MWKKMWDLDVLGTTNHFLWKPVNNILPTKLNLWQRKIIEDSKCPISKPEEEYIIHALWSYLAATNVWDEKNSPINK